MSVPLNMMERVLNSRPLLSTSCDIAAAQPCASQTTASHSEKVRSLDPSLQMCPLSLLSSVVLTSPASGSDDGPAKMRRPSRA